MDRNTSFQCRHCGQDFDKYRDLFEHVQQHHPLVQTGGRDISTRDLNETLPILSCSKNNAQLNSTITGSDVIQIKTWMTFKTKMRLQMILL